MTEWKKISIQIDSINNTLKIYNKYKYLKFLYVSMLKDVLYDRTFISLVSYPTCIM